MVAISRQLQEYFNSLVRQGVFPGCCYCVIDGNNDYIGFVGNKQVYPNIEVNDINTVYDIASLTKVIVTNTLLTKLLASNKIKLDELVSNYIDGFKYKDITIMDLITHSSGLISSLDKNKLAFRSQFFTELERKYNKGSKIIYQDINYIILGFIIEHIYNNSLDQVANDVIFKPLNMVNTCFNPFNKDICAPTEYSSSRGLIKGIVHDEKALFLNGYCGSAGVFSDIFDMTKFAHMVLNNGNLYIPQCYIDLWFKTYINDNGCERGMGWLIGRANRMCYDWCSNEAITHTGFTGTHMTLDRIKKFGIIVLSNRIHPNRSNQKIIDRRQEINNTCYYICRK